MLYNVWLREAKTPSNVWSYWMEAANVNHCINKDMCCQWSQTLSNMKSLIRDCKCVPIFFLYSLYYLCITTQNYVNIHTIEACQNLKLIWSILPYPLIIFLMIWHYVHLDFVLLIIYTVPIYVLIFFIG